jgi:hypothetical protein
MPAAERARRTPYKYQGYREPKISSIKTFCPQKTPLRGKSKKVKVKSSIGLFTFAF